MDTTGEDEVVTMVGVREWTVLLCSIGRELVGGRTSEVGLEKEVASDCIND
jgi:hypothetical protein